MANAESFDLDSVATLYCYVNDSKGKVEALTLYGLTGLFFRRNADWFPIERTDKDLIDYLNSGKYSAYRIDWEELTEMPDPADKRAWEHTLVNQWDDGEDILIAQLEEYGHLIGTGPVAERSDGASSNEG